MAGLSLRSFMLRGLAAFVLACCAVLASSAADDGKVKGKITYLWPIHISSISLSGNGAKYPTLETDALSKELADIGLRGFREYLKNVLPKELKLDPELYSTFSVSDHSRVNIAFQRWQKRVFADLYKLPVEDFSSRGEIAPRLEGINYTWPELYDSSGFARLQSRIVELTRLYLARSGYTDVPQKFRIFVWVEVFDKGDALRPGSRIEGAYVAGRYFAQCDKGSIKFNFEDPRGINPPFGKTYSHAPYEGNLVLHPVWNSYFVTPNMKNHSTVSYSFLVYPAEGTRRNFKDDKTGAIIVTRNIAGKVPKM